MSDAQVLKRWSYSALSTFEQCPRKYQHQYVLMDVERKDTEATLWGKRVHDAMEQRVMHGTALPEEFPPRWEVLAKAVAALPGVSFAELPVFLDHDRKHCAHNAHESTIWLKAYIDLIKVDGERNKAIILDWKTGSPKYLKPDQLRLYALLAFIAWPTLEKVRMGYVILKENRMGETYRMNRDETVSEWARFDERLEKLESARRFDRWPKRTGPLCAWCDAYKQGRCGG